MAKQKNNSKKLDATPDLSVLEGWYSYAKEISRPKHWDFFVIDQFLRGNHDIKGSADNNTLQVSNTTDSLNFPINKIWANFRAVRAYVTRHRPIVDIDIDEDSEEAKTYARRAKKLLERDNKLNNSRKINKEWVYYAVKYGVGYRQVGYDPENKVSIRWSIDPMDLLVGSRTGKFEDAPYIIKTVVRTVGYWRNKFPKANIVPDNKVAADEYKELAIQMNQQNSSGNTQRVEDQTAIGYEFWYRLFEENSLGGLVNKCLKVGNEIVETIETPYKEYPFIAYEADITPNEMYPEGHLKHIIAPQRMLNLLNTQLLEYNHVVNRGRYQMPKGSGFTTMMAKEGHIIQYNQGKPIQVLPPAPVNPMLQWQISYADDAIKVLGAQNDASLGATPERVSSGAAIEALQSGDSNNISDLRDNFEDALALEAQMILNVYSLFEGEGVVLTDKLPDGQIDRFAVVGEQAVPSKVVEYKGEQKYIEDNGSYLDYTTITADNHVTVSVSSQFGETKAARFELLKELVQLGMPIKFLFQHLEFPNSDDILERIAEENIAEMMKAQQMQEQQAPAEESVQGPVPIPDQDIEAVGQF